MVRISNGPDHEPNIIDHPNSDNVRNSSPHCIGETGDIYVQLKTHKDGKYFEQCSQMNQCDSTSAGCS